MLSTAALYRRPHSHTWPCWVCLYLALVVLQVLQNGSVAFEPPLDEAKQRAIDSLGMGVENKIVLRFSAEDVFWPERLYLQCTDQRFRFMNLHSLGKVGVLVAHVPPPFARGYDELDDAAVVDEVLRVLRRMFKGPPDVKPLEAIVTHWEREEFSCGSYSYQPVGSSVECVRALALPTWQQRLAFAGEATSADGFQCVHGAFETGCKAAEVILAEREREM